jgi:hypothetical protein
VRRPNLLLIALAVLAFLGISALLARAFNADGTERSAITSLIQAEGAGSAPRMRLQLDNCSSTPACRARTATLAASLRRPGGVVILTLDTSASFTLASSTGTARVAWDTTASKLPIVQCVRVHRAGSVLTGFTVHLVRLSARIKSDSDCPSRF